MAWVSEELKALVAVAIRDAKHSHNPAYGRALVIEELLQAVEGELAGLRYSKQERRSARQVTLEAMNHARRMVP
ncbi:hypothetical protein [Nocardia wallacei]|uniref:hypothetical protein n=1 Tax=Nocardia wallacei TaxID=480035 RepID=UPI002458054E|nr:hypothetical protein [Nocardia wallacei]